MKHRLLKINEVVTMTCFSKSSIYNMMKAGEFPPNIKLGCKAVAWLESDINDWIENRKFYTPKPVITLMPIKSK